MQQSIKKDIWFEGQEEDMFRTAFAALNISHQPNRHIRLNLDLSGYYTHETETFDIRSEYVLSEKPLDTSEDGQQQENGNTMGEFHGGSFRCAIKSKCPIIPMAFVDSFKVLDQKGSAPVSVQLHYLPAISYEEYKNLKSTELAALVKARIQAVMDSHCPS